MKFGPVPLDQAVGAILAHSIQLPDGRRLRKGIFLDAAQAESLRAAGIFQPIVAQLGSNDVHENAAAHRLANALVPDSPHQCVRIGPAAHGASFLYATTAGILSLDVSAITRANRIDPAITIATLVPFTRVSPGIMVGSIKTISYAVPERNIRRAEIAAHQALSVIPVKIKTASFIETILTTNTPINPKGLKAVAQRLKTLGIALIETTRVSHDIVPLGEAIAAAKGEMILVLTASATSDRNDIAPSALRRAGGKLVRFGMPVDPGHLLFYGHITGRPVIGLPGCARSLVPNGADFVIERLACGLSISAQEFAAMGVGGLLKDTKARGMPRQTSG